MVTNIYVWPLAAFILTAIGWLAREWWGWRKAKREATKDAVETLNERKTLLQEMLNEIEDASQKEELRLKLDEVNTALLGLYAERLRHTLKDAGLPSEETLIVDGFSKLRPTQVTKLKEEIAEVERLPLSDSIWDLLAQAGAYYHAGLYQDAIETYNRIISLSPDNSIALRNRGNTYLRLASYGEAFADYNRSLELRPDDPVTLYNRGTTYTKLERYDEALADYNRSLELRPDDPTTLNNRGVNYQKLEKYNDALADYNRSLELRPDDPDTFFNLACLFSLQGKTGDALAYLEKAIEKDKKAREMAKTDNDFDNIREDSRFKKLIESD